MILPQKQVLIILTSFEGKYLKIYPSREKEMTGLLHISDLLLAGELSRVEAPPLAEKLSLVCFGYTSNLHDNSVCRFCYIFFCAGYLKKIALCLLQLVYSVLQ